MRNLAYLLVSLLLVATLVYGCDETTFTEPAATATDASFDFHGTRRGLSSNFDSDAEGWTLVGDANGAGGIPLVFSVGYSLQPYYDATSGNPGGAVYAADDGGRDWYFQAPTKFLGNRLGAYGGTLTFDLKVPVTPGLDRPDVILAGGDLTLVIDAGPSPAYPPMDWHHYSVGLAEGKGWKVTRLDGNDATEEQIKSVLKDVTVLRIRGEYYVGGDVGYLDNVRILPRGHSR